MAVFRERPYVQFNFVVNLGDGVTNTPQAGFQEISGIGMEVTITEYRPGNYAFNNVIKTAGLNKATDVTLKRGVIGSLDLYRWLDDVRNGSASGLRTVTIELKSEDRTTTVQTWRLINSRIMKHQTAALNAKGTDVAMEELTLSYERLEME
jgi:phage tail-like protein